MGCQREAMLNCQRIGRLPFMGNLSGNGSDFMDMDHGPLRKVRNYGDGS